MKRSRSRNRSGGGGGGGGKPQNNANRTFDSNGPDGVKIRGHAQHVFEKYQQLGRDAQSSGDRVLAENYMQHAEHYFRVLRAVQPQRPVHEIIGRDTYTNGLDIDFEDEGLNAAQAEADTAQAQAHAGGDTAETSSDNRPEQQQRPDGGRSDNQGRYENRDSRSDGQGGYSRDGQRTDNRSEGRQDSRRPDYRDNRERPSSGEPREAREPRADFRSDRSEPRQDRYEGRRDEPRREDSRRDEPRRDEARRDEARRDEPRREDTRRDEPRRDERPPRSGDRYETRRDRYEPRADRTAERTDPLPVVEPQAAPLTAEAPAQPSPVLRAQDGDVSHAPAFLQVRAPEATSNATSDSETTPVEAAAPRKRAPRPRKPAAPKAPAPESAGEV